MKFLLWHSPLTDRIFVSKATPTGKQSGEKQDMTNSFLGAVVQRWENKSETITAGNNEWEITIKKNKMIKTKTATKREQRNSKIVAMYEDLKIKQNGMKSAVVEHIAKETKSSVTTVNRVVKEVFKP